MGDPEKVLLVEQISYAQAGLKSLVKKISKISSTLEAEYPSIDGRLENLPAHENEIAKETLVTINHLIQDVWLQSLTIEGRLEHLDECFHKLFEEMVVRKI
jgi:hypothetical protein